MASDGPRGEPPLEAPPRPRPLADDDDFDQVERITRRVVAIGGRAVLVGLPVWLVLLLFLPRLDLSPMASFSLASLVAILAVVGAGIGLRRRGRAREAGAAGTGSTRVRIGPLGAVALTLLAVALLAYTIFVLRSA